MKKQNLKINLVKTNNSLRSRVQMKKMSKREAMIYRTFLGMEIEKMKFDEKLELFQQLEIAQGIRRGQRTDEVLPLAARKIIKKYETIPTDRQKNKYAENVKERIFISIRNSIAES